MNDLIEDHKNKKESSTIITGSVFDMQAYVNLVQRVFNANSDTSPDFQKDCDYLRNLCDEIGINVAKVKELIPAKKVEGEIS